MTDYFPRRELMEMGFSEVAIRALEKVQEVSGKAAAGTIADSGLTMAAQRILGRNEATSGAIEELTLSAVLDLIGSAAQGDILYRGASDWARLGAGTSGHFLKTLGPGANPTWGAGGSGALTLITETVTASSAANVQFSSISGVYRDLVVVVRGRGTTAATSVGIRMTFNNVTAGDYDYEYFQAENTTLTANAAAAQTSIYLGNLVASTGPADYADAIEATIFDYRGTTFQKAGMRQSTLRRGTTVANFFREDASFWWRSTAAITEIDVFPAADAFVDGTVVSLYGRT